MSAPVLTAKTPVQPPNSAASDRHANPLLSVAPVKRENFGWAAALSIITVVLFVILSVMLYLEYDKIKYI